MRHTEINGYLRVIVKKHQRPQIREYPSNLWHPCSFLLDEYYFISPNNNHDLQDTTKNITHRRLRSSSPCLKRRALILCPGNTGAGQRSCQIPENLWI